MHPQTSVFQGSEEVRTGKGVELCHTVHLLRLLVAASQVVR
jgi:hypothetical protein